MHKLKDLSSKKCRQISTFGKDTSVVGAGVLQSAADLLIAMIAGGNHTLIKNDGPCFVYRHLWEAVCGRQVAAPTMSEEGF